MQYLYLADEVIVLGPGGTVAQGLPESVNTDIIDKSQGHEEKHKQKLANEEVSDELNVKASKVEAQVEAGDLDRQTGDLEVYKYYFRHVGWGNLLIFSVFVLINVASASFSRE